MISIDKLASISIRHRRTFASLNNQSSIDFSKYYLFTFLGGTIG